MIKAEILTRYAVYIVPLPLATNYDDARRQITAMVDDQEQVPLTLEDGSQVTIANYFQDLAHVRIFEATEDVVEPAQDEGKPWEKPYIAMDEVGIVYPFKEQIRCWGNISVFEGYKVRVPNPEFPKAWAYYLIIKIDGQNAVDRCSSNGIINIITQWLDETTGIDSYGRYTVLVPPAELPLDDITDYVKDYIKETKPDPVVKNKTAKAGLAFGYDRHQEEESKK